MTTVAQVATSPNVVLIVADDLGYGELRCYNPDSLTPTPNIDALAANGVRFTNAYVTSPVCMPSRAGIMTGKFPNRFGVETNGSEENHPGVFGLPLDQQTLASSLKQAGYRNACVGKWHLGWREGFKPNERGFDFFYGIEGGGTGYFATSKQRALYPIYRNGVEVEETEYLTDAFRRRGVSFIRNWAKKKPFFLYMPLTAVHAPLEATQKYLDRFPFITERRRLYLSAMLSALDDAVGGILAELRRSEIEKETLVLFVSDNGGEPSLPTDNRPLSGGKFSLKEGGVRVPMIMSMAGRAWSNGQVYSKLTSATDIMPTILKRAGAPLPDDLDGVDLVPFVNGTRTGSPHSRLFFKWGPEWAVVTEKWKALHEVNHESLVAWDCLFDLPADAGESNDVKDVFPLEALRLRQQYADWQATLPPPLWVKWP